MRGASCESASCERYSPDGILVMHPGGSALTQQSSAHSLLSSHRREHDPIPGLKTRPHTAPRRCPRQTHAQNQNSPRPSSSSHALYQWASHHPNSPAYESGGGGGKLQRESAANEKGCDRRRRYFACLGTRAPGSTLHPSFAGCTYLTLVCLSKHRRLCAVND